MTKIKKQLIMNTMYKHLSVISAGERVTNKDFNMPAFQHVLMKRLTLG